VSPPKKQSRQNDNLDTICLKAAAESMLEVLKPWVKENPTLLLKRLQMPHIEKLADAAIAGFIKKRSEIDAMAREFNDPISDLWAP